MCGIAGIVGQDAANMRSSLRAMISAMARRGPDGHGEYLAPGGGCILGHARLAIIDVSENSRQPYVSADRNLALTYNGECYNYPALRQTFESKGRRFNSTGDTEVIFATLQTFGVKGLSTVNGMFALGHWDESTKQLILARDYYGQKPLYYSIVDGHLVFASEVRAMLASGLIARKASVQAISSFLSYGCVQPPQTIVDSVFTLGPGEYATFSERDGLTVGCWTQDMSAVAQDDLKNAFTNAVGAHLLSDVPIGIFLSGGIDSSAVLAAARTANSGKLITLTVGFPDNPEYSELADARQMAEVCESKHIEVQISNADAMNLLPRALASMDQPTVDGINTFVVAHAAREAGLKVALSGIGGDEIFGGYSSFKDVPAVARFKKLHLPTSTASSMLYDYAPSARRIAKISEGLDAPDDIASIWLARRRIFSSRQMKDIFPSRLPAEDGSKWSSGLSPERLSHLRKISADLNVGDAVSRLELNGYTEPMLLRDGDFMGMANSLEIRAPFLDLNFSRLALQIPAGKRLSRVTPKHYFVRALGNSLSTTVTNRPKQGFVLPFERWMLGGMKVSVDTAMKQLASTCGILDANACHQIWNDFQRSPQNVGWVRPWSLFVLNSYLVEHQLEVHNCAVQIPDSSATAHP